MTGPAASTSGSAEVFRRAVVTGAVIGLVAVGMRVPLPFVDPAAVALVFQHAEASRLSVLALGLAPFVNGFILVEVVALLLPALRRRRHGSFDERAPLLRAAWVVGVALAAVQAYAVVTFLREMVGPFGFALVPDGRPLVLAAIGMTLLAGSVLVAWAATVIGRRGLGNGFAVLLVALPLTGLPRRAVRVARAMEESKLGISPVAIVVLALMLAAFVFLLARTLRAREGVVPAVPAPTCGMVPVQAAAALLALPAALAGWLPAIAGVGRALRPGSTVHQVADTVLVLVLAPVAMRLFCAPRSVEAAWSAAGPGPEARVQGEAVRRALSFANALSLFLLLAIAIVPPLVTERVGLSGGSVLLLALVVAAVVLDLGAEVRARLRGQALVAAYPLHRVYAVEPVLAALAAAGIAAHARGRYFRALWHFFAPFAPVEVMVPPDRAAEAEQLCARIAKAEPAREASPARAAAAS